MILVRFCSVQSNLERKEIRNKRSILVEIDVKVAGVVDIFSEYVNPQTLHCCLSSFLIVLTKIDN